MCLVLERRWLPEWIGLLALPPVPTECGEGAEACQAEPEGQGGCRAQAGAGPASIAYAHAFAAAGLGQNALACPGSEHGGGRRDAIAEDAPPELVPEVGELYLYGIGLGL